MSVDVSIIIPTYNYGNYISVAIDSLLSQTYTNYEVMVIDDGSTDDTVNIVKSYNDNRIVYIYQQNQGANTARNRGLEESQGDYLIFLDADDLLDPRHIEAYLNTAISYPGANIYGPWVKGWFKNNKFHVLFEKGRCPGEDLLEYWLDNWWIQTGCILWPRQNLFKIGGWDESLHAAQDGDLAMRALVEDIPFVFCEEAPIAYVRDHKDNISISSTKSLRTYCSRYRVLNKIEDLLKKKNRFSKKYKLNLAKKHLYFSIESSPKYPEFSKKCFRKFKQLNGFSTASVSFVTLCFFYLLGLDRKIRFENYIAGYASKFFKKLIKY